MDVVISARPMFTDGTEGESQEFITDSADHDGIGQWIARAVENWIDTTDDDGAVCDAIDVTVSKPL